MKKLRIRIFLLPFVAEEEGKKEGCWGGGEERQFVRAADVRRSPSLAAN